ncbi:hypothetical protein NX02_16110 [Sphingomonas sanxanigenens DSM 19645 = NX02]|uniref:Uncharacterized protein n=1 Tax=Sphingomonas sanxanigenens DSM 19645 = NX02 TaxID=1123269 RepID=W0AEC3_9SPHN|nr:hypothetical protein NX02_16110 [Sphingomonas sanxanigenens DSM 19645 = NX02]
MNRQDFRYREFPDQFADMELWPLFQALLTDERVIGGYDTELRGADVEVRERLLEARRGPADRGASDRGPADPGPAQHGEAHAPSRTGLFSRYGGAAPEPAERSGNLRQFLGRLADKD